MDFSHIAIRKRSYELWTKAGSPANGSDAFWFQAEDELEKEDRHRKIRKEILSAGVLSLTVLGALASDLGHWISNTYCAQFGIPITDLPVMETKVLPWLWLKDIIPWLAISLTGPWLISILFSGKKRFASEMPNDLRAQLTVMFLIHGIIVSTLTWLTLKEMMSVTVYVFGSFVPLLVLPLYFFFVRRKAEKRGDEFFNYSMCLLVQALLWMTPMITWGEAINPNTRMAEFALVFISTFMGAILIVTPQVKWKLLCTAIALVILILVPQFQLHAVNRIFQNSGLGRVAGVEFSIDSGQAATLKEKGFALQKPFDGEPSNVRRVIDAYLVAKTKDGYLMLLPSQPATTSTILEKIPDSVTKVREQDTFNYTVTNPLADYQPHKYDLLLVLPEAEGQSKAHFEWALSNNRPDTTDQRWAHIWPSRKFAVVAFWVKDQSVARPPGNEKEIAARINAIQILPNSEKREEMVKAFYVDYLGISIDKLLVAAATPAGEAGLANGTFDFSNVRADHLAAPSEPSFPPPRVSFLSATLEREATPKP